MFIVPVPAAGKALSLTIGFVVVTFNIWLRLVTFTTVLLISTPVAILLSKLQYNILPLFPSHEIAPPERLATLLLNVEPIIEQFDELLAKLIAPPRRRAVLLINVEFLITPKVAPISNPIAPPLPVNHIFLPLFWFLSSL